MDIHLDLTFATHYQMRQMYRMVMDEDDDSTLDEIYPQLEKEVPEFVIPPSEIMQVMVLCREHTKEIPRKLQDLTEKYQADTTNNNYTTTISSSSSLIPFSPSSTTTLYKNGEFFF